MPFLCFSCVSAPLKYARSNNILCLIIASNKFQIDGSFRSVTQEYSKNENSSSPITSSNALPLNYRRTRRKQAINVTNILHIC